MIREVETAEELENDLVGPVLRSGELADAVIDAVEQDNPGRVVTVLDRGDYVRIHTEKECILTKISLEKYLGRAFELALLEREMPSFKGRLRTRSDEIRWFYKN
jgi:toluene monooxygenase system protein D